MYTPLSFTRTFLVLLVVGGIGACSTLHTYSNVVGENLFITQDVRSGTARLDVYSGESLCNVSYQGTVELSDKRVSIGLSGKTIYLDFNFQSGSYFTGYKNNSYGVYLIPRAGFHYEAAVSYVDNMYGVTLYEQDAQGGGRRKFQRIEPACNSK